MDSQRMDASAPIMDEEKMVMMISPTHGKILIREDTILANLQGCAGCGKAQFACAGVKKQWSALCWGKNSGRSNYCLLVTLSTTFALSLIATIFLCFTNAVNDAILSSMVIRNNSMAFRMWQRPAVQPLMKVHVFNYTNWDRVRDGLDAKLKVEDVGPYVYSQQIERVNVRFDGNESLTFQERNNFTFLPELSGGAVYDQINVPNLPLLGVISMLINKDMGILTDFGVNQVLKSQSHPHAFLKLPVDRFFWGYEDSIIDATKIYLSVLGQLKFKQFGLLVTKNGTVDDVLTINTGEKDKDKMNIIQKLNGEPHLKYWGNPMCNSLEGSDGTMFPPSLLDRVTPLNVMFPNLCRRIPFRYEKDVESHDGIPLMRYRMPTNVFDDPAHNPANQCFCEIDAAACPPRGVINVTACTMGVPLMVSFPHFYLGDPRLCDDVEGLSPDPMKHDSYLDIHPKLGISLNGKSSLQLNIQVKRNSQYTALSYLQHDMILPIAWIEMVVEELPESVRSLVYHGTYSTAAVQLGLIVFSFLVLIISGLGLLVMIVCKKPKPCVTLKKLPQDSEMKMHGS